MADNRPLSDNKADDRLKAALHALGEAPMQLMPQRLYTLTTCVALIQMPVATVVGAYLYTET